ncbi:MAG: WecB/TagA/CpsF family glycosyltransferase [Spirochaetes bacterium]|nr:WecB/TagA/CpsF family glycosyltransferase [Spirochaetota bacterium]
METIDLTSVLSAKGLRFDFPTERRLGALAMAWDDGANHQITFLRKDRLAAAAKGGEYASMLASADLVLLAAPQTADLAAIVGKARTVPRAIEVPLHRTEYINLYKPFEAEGEIELIEAFQPLKVLSILLSALELRGGSVFILGGRPAILQAAESNLKSTFPGLKVVGRSRGDYRLGEECAIMSAIQKSAPDMIIVGSLVRGEELWIPRHMRYTRSGIFFHDPSIIEVLAGKA